jgi:hypothetical protein
MVLFRKPPNALEERLKAIEREKRALRDRLAVLEAMPDLPSPGPAAPRLRGTVLPARVQRAVGEAPAPASAAVPTGVPGPDAGLDPEEAVSLDFEPGPDGVAIKHAAMPRIQRIGMVQPYASRRPATLPDAIGEPEYDRLRNYLGNGGGLHRLREDRKTRGNQRAKAIFMAGMVLLLAYILFRMMT